MKRKLGNKKSKSKKLSKISTNESVENLSSGNTESTSGAADIHNDEVDSKKEIETTPVVEKDQPQKVADTNTSSVVVNKPAGNLVYGRMRVKIKTPKVVNSQVAATEATPTRLVTDTSSQQVCPEKNEKKTSEKIEENEKSPPSINAPVPENTPKKTGSIKIKSSRNLSSSVLNPCTSALVPNEETRLKELASVRDSKSSDLELKAALEIIKKIMKMDAAEPFNTPVDPIALGIPDYFEVIDRPMDFGTICKTLESGDKYKNSEDVYKDVEYVWNNCYKYNKKGDYVVELMKRVKKNFMKYWMAAQLYCEQPQGSGGADSSQSKDDGSVKMQGKIGQVKKRPGVKRHKDGCLCAICVMMRRRQEREESLRREENLRRIQEGRPLLQSPVESPYQDTSSNMENSSGPDADSEADDKEELGKLNNSEGQYTPSQDRAYDNNSNLEKQVKGVEIEGSSQLGYVFGEKSREISTLGNDLMLIDPPSEQMKMLHVDRTAMFERNKRKKLLDKRERAKVIEKLHRFENPLLLNLCETLFPKNVKSVWSGPHSLVSHRDRSRTSSIHEAIGSFMN